MTKLLIVNNNMQLGGVQKALTNLLKELSFVPDLEITLLLFWPEGPLKQQIPDSVRVIVPTIPFRCWGITRSDAAPFSYKAMRAFFAALTKVIGRSATIRLAYPFQKKLRDFDVAVSYLHSGPQKTFYGGCNEFVLHCVEAKKKITFLHCDFEKINANCAENTKLYSAFDAVAACSEGCRDAFLRVLPQFAEKTAVVPNCHNYKELLAISHKTKTIHSPCRLITVSRLGKEKGVLRALRAIAALGERASGIRYEIIGDGIEYSAACSLVTSLGLKDKVELLGAMPEPYERMREADVLLIPSVSEAAPLVIGEAAALGLPILTTETSSAHEMVERTGFGWVCDNSEEGIQQGIEHLIDAPEDVKEKMVYLQGLSFHDRAARDSFLELID